MKIANILLSDQNGGVEQSFVNYCLLLQKLGHRVCAIVGTGAPYIKDLKKLNLEIFEVDNNFGYYDSFAINKINKIITDKSISLVFAHTGRAIILARKAIKKVPQKIPLIAVNHSNNVKRSIGADIVLSVNQNIHHKAIDYGQAADKSFVFPNFIDVSGAENVELQNFVFDQNKPVVVGFIGRLAKEKGLEYLIKAVKILTDKNYQIHLKIAGCGEEENNLKELCSALNLVKQVQFMNWVDDKKKFFSEIDIFCLPSSNETFGIVLLEAMLYNKPIIATTTDGAKTIIKDGISGLLVDNSEPELLPELIANSILELLNDPKMVLNLTTNAKKDLIKFYSLPVVLELLSDIIKKVDPDSQLKI